MLHSIWRVGHLAIIDKGGRTRAASAPGTRRDRVIVGNGSELVGLLLEILEERGMRPLIAGNWKMHGLESQLGQIEAMVAAVKARPPSSDILICPPGTLVARAVQIAEGLIAIGGQDCHSQISGAFTGDISAEMLKDAGASPVIVGHSERRQHHGETDAIVAAKAKAARQTGLVAIVCIGETDAERNDGKALSVCADQIEGSLPRDANARAAAIAYEPLWAIGTGRTPAPQEIAHMHLHIRQTLLTRLGAEGREMRILHGGSVTSRNARKILALPEVGGVLVGGGSLKAADFAAVFGAASAQP
jgi:triosephosphate isomerase